jgi:hypothetical protein
MRVWALFLLVGISQAQEVQMPALEVAAPPARVDPLPKLAISGATLQATAWTVATATGAIEGQQWRWSGVPFIGPLVAAGLYCNEAAGCSNNAADRAHVAVSVINSVAQLGGFAMFVTGVVRKKRVQNYSLVPNINGVGGSLAVSGQF